MLAHRATGRAARCALSKQRAKVDREAVAVAGTRAFEDDVHRDLGDRLRRDGHDGIDGRWRGRVAADVETQDDADGLAGRGAHLAGALHRAAEEAGRRAGSERADVERRARGREAHLERMTPEIHLREQIGADVVLGIRRREALRHARRERAARDGARRLADDEDARRHRRRLRIEALPLRRHAGLHLRGDAVREEGALLGRGARRAGASGRRRGGFKVIVRARDDAAGAIIDPAPDDARILGRHLGHLGDDGRRRRWLGRRRAGGRGGRGPAGARRERHGGRKAREAGENRESGPLGHRCRC